MAFDVSALAAYTKENQDTLVTASLFDARTQQIIQSEGVVMPEVASAERIPIMDTDVVWQAGGTCGFNSSGTTTFSNRVLTVGAVKVNESLCPKVLKSKYLQLKMKAGSRPQEIPFEQEYTDRKAGVNAQQLETAIWQGDTASGNANLNKFDGFVKLIDAAGTAINSNVAQYTKNGPVLVATGISETNVRDIVKGVWKAIPAKVKGKSDVRIFAGWDVYEAYIGALVDANLYAYTAKNDAQAAGEITIPGTQYKLTAVHGLDGTNRLFALRTSNMYFGCELAGEDTKFELFYAKEADEVRYVNEFKAGVQVAFPNEIVHFKLQ